MLRFLLTSFPTHPQVGICVRPICRGQSRHDCCAATPAPIVRGLVAVVRRRRWRDTRLKHRLLHLGISLAYLRHVAEAYISKLIEYFHAELLTSLIVCGSPYVVNGRRGLNLSTASAAAVRASGT